MSDINRDVGTYPNGAARGVLFAALLVAVASSCGGSNEAGLFGGTQGGASGAGAQGGNGTGDGGSGAALLSDAAPDGPGAAGSDSDVTAGTGGTDGGQSDACAVMWCRDSDGDGHGDPAETQQTCDAPGSDWVTSCDDCHDDNADVHPGVTGCHGVAYTASDGVTKSFDYDCSGEETPCQALARATGNCMLNLASISCTGSGYLPNPDREAESTQDDYCGSTRYRVCNVAPAVGCLPTEQTDSAVPCH
jgi:hypothetical protein